MARMRSVGLLLPAALLLLICAVGAVERDRPAELSVCPGNAKCPGTSPLVANIKVLLQSGARPHYSPSGDTLVFDRMDSGRWDVYLSDLTGHVTPYTAGKFGGRSAGNAVFDPSGNYIVFIAEEPRHFMQRERRLVNPGMGFFCNLWAGTRDGSRFHQLTHIPVKQTRRDGLPVMGAVNPHFSRDGSMLIWTERYDKGSGSWGRWRVQGASFAVRGGVPELGEARTLVDPSPGNYVTAMGFLDNDRLLVAGNLDGQHEYGMDQYVVNLKTGAKRNLTNTPDFWEEGSCISQPDRKIVYMSNAASRYKLDFQKPNGIGQKVERDYWIMDADGSNRQRLTYFNDPQSREYLGGRNIVAACDISPDGLHLAGTFGLDTSSGPRPDMMLKVILIDFKHPI